jgi:hypothetical protein
MGDVRPGSVPRQNEDTAARTIEGEAFIVNAETSELHNLNPVGTRVFELVDGARTVKDIVEAIVEEYEVDHDTAERDVAEFLAVLSDKGLVVWA